MVVVADAINLLTRLYSYATHNDDYRSARFGNSGALCELVEGKQDGERAECTCGLAGLLREVEKFCEDNEGGDRGNNE